ncbi:DUF885 family protein [Sphingomonas sp. PB2P19]|uniref:DUF885 family protein n=1 Tax=Sphingomonas rhamnosi TaxID=3096156 RepID=UPI002FCB1FD3
MTPHRRAVLGGIGAALLSPTLARAAPDPLRDALDRAAGEAPETALRTLGGFDADTLHGADRLDLTAARAGLAIDAMLMRDFGRRSPYRVTPLAGAWRAAKPDAAAIDAETAGLMADAEAGLRLPLASLDRTVTALGGARAAARPDIAAAIDRQIQRLTGMRDTAPSHPGIGRLRDGESWYTLLLNRGLGDGHSPAAAERRLLAELDRQQARAATLFARIGMTQGSVAERYTALWRDERYLYPDSDAGRASAIADMTVTLATLRSRVPALVGAVPAWTLDVTTRPLTPQEIAAGRQGFREVPTPTRPGAYIVDLKDIRRRPSWTLPSVVAHELLPGHMIQLGLEGIRPPHPLRADYAAAFVEGWGIYAEQLAAEAYADPRAELGHVHWLLFRIARALVDIGIHLHGWSLVDARVRFTEWLGEPAYFAPFDTELARIPLEPASRLAEALAWLAIADGAQGKSGAARVAYHQAILADGRKRTEQVAR